MLPFILTIVSLFAITSYRYTVLLANGFPGKLSAGQPTGSFHNPANLQVETFFRAVFGNQIFEEKTMVFLGQNPHF